MLSIGDLIDQQGRLACACFLGHSWPNALGAILFEMKPSSQPPLLLPYCPLCLLSNTTCISLSPLCHYPALYLSAGSLRLIGSVYVLCVYLPPYVLSLRVLVIPP